MALSDHSLRILADHLEVHWTRDQFQYVMDKLGELSVLFRDECRVAGYPVENTHVDEGLDRLAVGRGVGYIHATDHLDATSFVDAFRISYRVGQSLTVRY